MKTFRQLEVKSSQDKLIKLLNGLKSIESTRFVFMKKETKDYANNIFVPENSVACFKATFLKDFDSLIWLCINSEKMYVANITSRLIPILGYDRYNSILADFYEHIKPYFTYEFSVIFTEDIISLESLLSKETFQALNSWEKTCNKSSPLSHVYDREHWFEFISQIVDNGESLNTEQLEKWLVEDRGWFREIDNDYDTVTEIVISYENGKDLLEYYKARH